MNRIAFALGIAALTMICASSSAFAYTGEKLAKEAKVTVEAARAIALRVRPGTVTDTELEREGGGLRYSFDIKSGTTTYEVGVDAKTGTVLENNPEGAKPD